MAEKLPKHIVKQYGSSHAFRAEKRQLLREMAALLKELELGCAFFPDGGRSVKAIAYELRILKSELSAKSWGR